MKIISLILFMGLLVLGCSERRTQTEPLSSRSPARIATVEEGPAVIEIAGTVRAGDVAELASRFGGYVRSVNVRAGDRVRRGDLLILLDESILQAQGSKIQAAEQEVQQAIEEARNHVKAAEAQKDLASNTFERYRVLYEKKAASKQEYEEALSRKDAANAAWKAAERRFAQTTLRLDQVRADRRELAANTTYQRITAPFDGVISSVPADTGTFVPPGQTVVALEDPKTFHFLFAVEQNLLASFSKNITVRIPAVSQDLLEATILEISPTADPQTRTFRVKALLPSRPLLRSGLSGVVQIKGSAQSLWIPAEFVQITNDLETVLVRQQNEWRRVLVKSGIRQGDSVEILSGLKAGDQVGLLEKRL